MSTEKNEQVEPSELRASEAESGEISEESLGAVSGGWSPDAGDLPFTYN